MTSKKRVVLITGAESGIGKSTSKIFLDNGYKVICTYLKNNNNKNTKDIEYHRIDITKSKDWENLALYIKKKFKKIDVLVNSAGVRLSGNLETTSMSDWSYHLNNNVTGTFLACKYILPFLKKAFLRKGKIYLQARKVPVTLLLRWYDQSLIDVVSKFPLNLTPALFTKTSIFLNFFLIYRARFSQSLLLVISMR